MNSKRKKELKTVIEALEGHKAFIETVKDEEDEKFCNMTDSQKESDRGCKIEENVDKLENALYSLQESIDMLIEIL